MLHNKSEYYELPTKYNETVVRLLLQSPKRIFAYWDICDETIQSFSKQHVDYSSCVPVLRIINLTHKYYYDIKIDPYANNYYIDIEDENCDYKVELARTNNNKFMSIYKSNSVTVPNSVPNGAINDDEVMFKNYICLNSKKMRVKYPRHNLRQDYGDLPFGIDDNISSGCFYG